MFSRGNLSEKKRILELPALTKEGLGGMAPADTSAVDLYAGIGYFAFSYVKAGVIQVLCWELNPWSVEGLRRGAAENGWSCSIPGNGIAGYKVEDTELRGHDMNGAKTSKNSLLVFQEDNSKAALRIEEMRQRIRPIRHVNCGLLPTSMKSWETAVQVLDPVLGGWIHAHENIAVAETKTRKIDVVKEFQALLKAHSASKRALDVSCSHVEVIKSYGPGINHVVFDIAILPSSSSTDANPQSSAMQSHPFLPTAKS